MWVLRPQIWVPLVVFGVVFSAMARYYGGQDWRETEQKRKEILAKIPDSADVLINVTMELMPGTPELTALGRKATPALTRGLLDNADDGVRAICAGVLAEIRDPAAGPALREALKDRHWQVRSQAAYGLGMLALAEYGRVLEDLVKDPEEQYYVKSQAIEAIGNMGYVPATATLERLILKPSGENLEWNALAALWHMRNLANRGKLISVFLHVLKNKLPGSESVVDYLGQLAATEATGTLAKYYVGQNEWVKNQVILAMGKIGDKAAKEFLKDVMRTTQVARHLNNAAIALARLDEREAAEGILAGLLQDRKAYLRVNAAFALGEIEAKAGGTIQRLVAALGDPNDYVRSEAAVALGRLKAKPAEEALLKLAASDNPFVQLDAVVALTRIDFAKHRHLVMDKLLVHKDPKFARVIQRGIRILAEEGDSAALEPLLAYIRGYGADVSEALSLIPRYKREEAAQFFPSIEYLAHTSGHHVFQTVMRIIRDWQMTEMTQPLLERLYRTSPWGNERPILYYTLGKIGSKDLISKLQPIQEEQNANKLYKWFALANLGDEKALKDLLALVESGTLPDKRDASFLLGGLDGDAAKAAAPRLRELMSEADLYSAVAAAAALVNQGDTKALEFLYKIMKEGIPVVADEAARVLRVAQHQDVDKVLTVLVGNERSSATKQRAMDILQERNQKDFR